MRPRGRLLVALTVALAVVAAGTAFERVLGIRRPMGTTAIPETSGAWFCPHGGGEGWRAWIVAVNPSDRDAQAVLTTYGRGEPDVTTEVLPGDTERYLEVPAAGMASASVLEFFGPPVVAGMVVLRAGGAGLAAEPCARDAGRRWYLPEGTSVRGQSSQVVVVNPFDQEAVIDVTIVTGSDLIRHGNLRGVVIEPDRAKALDLNRFALGKETLTARVNVALGRVAVAGFGIGTRQGLRATIGVGTTSTRWLFPATGDSDPTGVLVTAPGSSDVPLQILTQDADGTKVVLEEETVPARSAETLEVPQEGAAVVVEGAGPVPFVAGRRLVPAEAAEPQAEPPKGGGKGGKGGKDREEEPAPVADPAASSGIAAAGSAWVAPSALPAAGGSARLVIQNPGGSIAEGTVTYVSDQGPVGDAVPFSVEAGHTRALDLVGEVGMQPVAAIVRLTSGNVAVAQVAEVDGGYAVATGIAVESVPGQTNQGIS